MENDKYLDPSSEYKVKQESKFAPVAACLRYICNRVLKKPSTWIVLAIFAVAYVVLLALPALFDKVTKPFMLASLNLPATICLCFGAGVQGIMRAINTFIDPQRDGTEILLISKPITRGQIILSRFLFLFTFGLVQAIATTILASVSVFLVGSSAFEEIKLPVATVLGGGLLASFLSFMIMGSVAILVGLFSDGKVARTVPMVVLSLSGTLAIVNAQIAPIITGDPLYEISKSTVSEMNKDLKALKNGDSSSGIPSTLPDGSTNTSTVKWFSSSMPIFRLNYADANNQFIYVDGYFNYSDGTSIWSRTLDVSSAYSKDNPLDSNKKAWIDYLTQKFIKVGSIAAKGTTAISFLNPQSAFLTMSGVGKSFQAGLGSGLLSPNYKYDGFKVTSETLKINEYYTNESDKSVYHAIVYNSTQVDAPWAVGIMWGSLFIISSAILIWAYYRKDFK